MMKPCSIREVKARQIYDSRANPTIEVDITLENGVTGRGIVPSGASTGIFEALELRDGGKAYGGKGVSKALDNIRQVLAPQLIGMDVTDQRAIDEKLIALDGTPNKSALGANAILGCSMAACHAGANYYQMPLYRYLGGAQADTIPVPMVQIIGGGAHAAGAIDIQDFLVIPMKADTFAEGYSMVVEVYNAAKRCSSRRASPFPSLTRGASGPPASRPTRRGCGF